MDVFLSHSSRDRDVAAALKRRLEAAIDFRVFLSSDPESGIAPGADWERDLYERLRDCDAVLAL